MVYVIVREWTHDLDKKDTSWYTLFISLDQKKAEQFLAYIDIYDYQTDLHLCVIPFDEPLDIVFWKKYIVKTRKLNYNITFKNQIKIC
jgi:hypothetical protein